MEILALVASIVSIIIGGLAIWLSLHFYKMSTAVAESAKEASRNIASGVDQLKILFDKFYEDTFGIFKYSYTQMIDQLLPTDKDGINQTKKEIETNFNKAIDKLKADILKKIDEALALIPKEKALKVSEAIHPLIDRTIAESGQIALELKGETTRTRILRFLDHLPEGLTVIFYNDLQSKLSIPPPIFNLEIMFLKTEGYLFFPQDVPSTITPISLNRSKISGYFKK